jgi:protein-L-isoaspartate(D-aspartate) O-methyltransferase
MVMKSVDRGNYYSNRQQAYIDRPMEIGDGQTISAPHMHSLCLELLSDFVQPGSRVLDVGSGSGYLTACFARMVGSTGVFFHLCCSLNYIKDCILFFLLKIKI